MATQNSYFEAFRWPMPKSFAAPVAASRFELGDVLYREVRAYEPWSGSVPEDSLAIQVLDPPRSARGTLPEGDTDRRRANWSSPVRVLLIDPRSGSDGSEERLLSQGQLLTAWWQGDERWLEVGGPEPEFPKTARDLFAKLESTQAAWALRALKKRIRSGSVFALVLDLASDASRAKARLVLDQLHASGKVKSVDLLPLEAGLDASEAYHPTLVLRGFLLPERSVDAVEATLRPVLYRGGLSAGAQTQASKRSADEPPPDRFSIGRHGLLFSL